MNPLKRFWSRYAGGVSNAQALPEAGPEMPEQAVRASSLAMVFLFNTVPELRIDKLLIGLEASAPLIAPLRIFDHVNADDGQHARLAFDDVHQFRWVGSQSPAPQEATRQSIQSSHWRQQDKEVLRRHTAHAMCWYEGSATDPSEQMIALLRLAGAFADLGLVGVVDPEAWNCIPAHVLAQMLKPDMLASCRSNVPVGLWTGFVKLFKSEDEVWFCTKGFHRWGIRDFAFSGPHAESERASALFNGLFHYLLSSRAVLDVGQTAQFGSELLRFGPVTEFAESLESPLGTLVVERAAAAAGVR